MGPSAEPIRVVVVDDHELFRNGLVEMLLSQHELAVVGVAASGAEALESIPRLRPDVALMDLSMPGISGVEVTRRLAGQLPDTCVVALTVMAERGDRARCDPRGRMRLHPQGFIDRRDRCGGPGGLPGGRGCISPQLTRNLMRGICALATPQPRRSRG